MPWYQMLGLSVLVGIILFIVFRVIDLGLDWVLQKHVRRQIEDQNRRAPVLPIRVPGASLVKYNDDDED